MKACVLGRDPEVSGIGLGCMGLGVNYGQPQAKQAGIPRFTEQARKANEPIVGLLCRTAAARGHHHQRRPRHRERSQRVYGPRNRQEKTPAIEGSSTMTSQVPLLTLNNGVQMPAVGLGVFQTPPEQTTPAVQAALEAGYRHIDTAAAYGNEHEVGEGIRRSGIGRPDVFIETKVWISDYGYDQTLHAFDKSAAKLGTDWLDLLILHQPLPSDFDRTTGAYQALERLLADGKVRAIGVSNFMPEHLRQLLDATSTVPAVNQVELHPYFTQPDVQKADAQHGILTQAWSPIGGITFYRGTGKGTLQDPAILAIASAYGKTAAQVMLRWHLQRGRSVIPKSIRPERIAENFDVFDFDLSAGELDTLDGLDTGTRGGPDPASITLEHFGRPIPEA